MSGVAGRNVNNQGVMVARYYVVLLARTQRWLPPVLFYGIALAIDSTNGQPAAAAYAYSAVFLLPVSAWLGRAILTAEPPESAAIIATVAGPARARLAALSAATGYGLLCALVGTFSAIAKGGTGGASVAFAGIATELICVLVGTAAGALAAPPLVPAAGWSVLLVGLLALGLLVARISPAAMAIRALTISSDGGASGASAASHLHFPILALPLGLLVTAAAWAASTAAATRR